MFRLLLDENLSPRVAIDLRGDGECHRPPYRIHPRDGQADPGEDVNCGNVGVWEFLTQRFWSWRSTKTLVTANGRRGRPHQLSVDGDAGRWR